MHHQRKLEQIARRRARLAQIVDVGRLAAFRFGGWLIRTLRWEAIEELEIWDTLKELSESLDEEDLTREEWLALLDAREAALADLRDTASRVDRLCLESHPLVVRWFVHECLADGRTEAVDVALGWLGVRAHCEDRGSARGALFEALEATSSAFHAPGAEIRRPVPYLATVARRKLQETLQADRAAGDQVPLDQAQEPALEPEEPGAVQDLLVALLESEIVRDDREIEALRLVLEEQEPLRTAFRRASLSDCEYDAFRKRARRRSEIFSKFF